MELLGGEPFGFAGVSVSWLLPGWGFIDPGATADWEYAGVVPITEESMVTRLSMTTQLHEVVAFIGPLQGFEARSYGARVLRNRHSVSPMEIVCLGELISFDLFM
jgi:hypothetical protein